MKKEGEYNGKKTNYIITDKGVIYSLNYRGSGKRKKMKQFDHKGYRCSNITIDGKCKRLLVHRLVAENFISNPYNKPEVNHKSGKKKNNKVLERISGVYWMAATVVYLAWSFITFDWGFTWIVWPIAGVLYGLIAAICNAVIGVTGERK